MRRTQVEERSLYIFVEAIRQAHPEVRQAVLDAFFAMPRHVFLDSFYERVQGEGVIWRYRTLAEMTPEEQVEAVYRDRALTISLDTDQHRFPASSSSQPSVMAAMLHALDVCPGHHVLEIGTGTGYNAAILAHLVGDPRLVSSVDIDTTLLERARLRIAQTVGPGMYLETRNGVLGVPEHAPFDRIEVTGAFPEVPSALLAQLALGGRLILNVRRNLMNIMLLVEKDQCGDITGQILPFGANFMMLYDGASPHQRVSVPQEPIAPVLHSDVTRLFVPSNLNHPDFGFFLQCHLPGARQLAYKQFIYLEDASSGRLIQFEGNEVRGDASLWQELVEAAGLFQQLGFPKCQDVTFRVDQGRQLMLLGNQQWVWYQETGGENSLPYRLIEK